MAAVSVIYFDLKSHLKGISWLGLNYYDLNEGLNVCSKSGSYNASVKTTLRIKSREEPLHCYKYMWWRLEDSFPSSCILISNQLNGIYWGCIQGNIIPEGRYLISYRSPFIWSFIDNKSVLSPHQVEVKLERHRQLDVIYFGYWGSNNIKLL